MKFSFFCVNECKKNTNMDPLSFIFSIYALYVIVGDLSMCFGTFVQFIVNKCFIEQTNELNETSIEFNEQTSNSDKESHNSSDSSEETESETTQDEQNISSLIDVEDTDLWDAVIASSRCSHDYYRPYVGPYPSTNPKHGLFLVGPEMKRVYDQIDSTCVWDTVPKIRRFLFQPELETDLATNHIVYNVKHESELYKIESPLCTVLPMWYTKPLYQNRSSLSEIRHNIFTTCPELRHLT